MHEVNIRNVYIVEPCLTFIFTTVFLVIQNEEEFAIWSSTINCKGHQIFTSYEKCTTSVVWYAHLFFFIWNLTFNEEPRHRVCRIDSRHLSYFTKNINIIACQVDSIYYIAWSFSILPNAYTKKLKNK